MTQAIAPPVGADFVRPLNLPAVERELLSMQTVIFQRGALPAEYSPLLDRVLEAWEFYRPSQPQGYQGHIDLLISRILGAARVK
jgi:hypothetical protein